MLSSFLTVFYCAPLKSLLLDYHEINFLALSSIMAHNFEVYIGAWMNNKCSIITWVVVVSQARLAIRSCACLKSSGIEVFDLLSVYIKY